MAARRSPPPLTASIADPAIEWSEDEAPTRPSSVEHEVAEVAKAYRAMSVMDRAWLLGMARLKAWSGRLPQKR